jgi:polyhydroxyalkanoate synthesis regulator phasin
MKLAAALQLRAELQNKSDSLQKRICDNLRVQQGELPLEDPQELLKELLQVNNSLADLIGRINMKNNQVTLPDGRLLAQALIQRDSIMKKRKILAAIADSAFGREIRMPRVIDVKMTVTLSMHDLHAQIDDLSRQFREVDNTIQSVNWSTEL